MKGIRLKNWKIYPSQLKGKLTVPSSKSQSIRALLFATLAKGKSVLTDLLPCPDMIHTCRLLGADIQERESVEVNGLGGKIDGAKDIINAGNSGLILRLVGAIAALSSKPIIITGDRSIRESRPIIPLIEGLNQLGGLAFSILKNGQPPIFIQGPIRSGYVRVDGEDSQPISGLLIAGALAPGPVKIFVNNPGEIPWIELTRHWLEKFGISSMAYQGSYYEISGNALIEGFSYKVPGDFSSLAFPLVAAILTNSEVYFDNLDFDDLQPDKQLITILQQMGAKIELEEKGLCVKKGGKLHGMQINVNGCIDTLPILAVLGCLAEGETELVGGRIARKKESNRITAMATELRKMGGRIEEQEEGLLIHQSSLRGGIVESYSDHRIALSLAVAGLAAKGKTVVKNIGCVVKTFPNFQHQMLSLGADIQ
ncbi:MAG: 3-phosphoshikimate 1-carboxyvinyltransferase [Chlamydiales bacterium]